MIQMSLARAHYRCETLTETNLMFSKRVQMIHTSLECVHYGCDTLTETYLMFSMLS